MRHLFNGPVVLSLASDKAKLLAENFSKKTLPDDSGISLPAFPSRTNMILHNNPSWLRRLQPTMTPQRRLVLISGGSEEL